MKQFMLDTNVMNYLIKADAKVAKRILAEPITSICISVITEGDLL